MKPLRIEYDGRVLFDGDVLGMNWSESADQVMVTGRLTEKPGLAELSTLLTTLKQQNGKR